MIMWQFQERKQITKKDDLSIRLLFAHNKQKKKMPRKKSHKTPIEVGDFVFAKVNGYRAWPARVLEVNPRYQVYFYGTCNTTKVNRNQIFPYIKHKNSLGNLIKPRVGRKSTFRVAMRNMELAYNDPDNDIEYFNLLEIKQGRGFSDTLVYGMLNDSTLSDSTEEEEEAEDDDSQTEEEEAEDDDSLTEEDQSQTESDSMIVEISD